MKKVEITIYQFNELSDNAKAKAIINYNDININDTQWDMDIINEYKSKLESEGFIDSKIYYSGFCSQGDGASFDCNSIDIEKFIESNECKGKNYDRIKKIKDYLCFTIDKNSYGCHYSHENTRYIDSNHSARLYEKEFKFIGKIIAELQELIEERRLQLSKGIYRKLYETYFDLTSEELVKQALIDNDYYFTEDGKIYTYDS
jgi:hypothetical protein